VRIPTERIVTGLVKPIFRFRVKDLIETMDFTYTNPEGFTFTFTFSFDFEDDYFDNVDTNDESS
jgi:hypothetical protein